MNIKWLGLILLITATGTKLAPSYYLMIVALLSLWALINSQRSRR